MQAAVMVVGAFAAVVVLVAPQLVRAGRSNPPPERTVQARAGGAYALAAVLARSCGDCHSNEAMPRAYLRTAPVSWVAARAVTEGRRAVNFSEWGAYSPDQRRALLASSCRAASAGTMPGLWTVVRPGTRLSAGDVETICAAAAGESRKG
jgi:hypothetical protein